MQINVQIYELLLSLRAALFSSSLSSCLFDCLFVFSLSLFLSFSFSDQMLLSDSVVKSMAVGKVFKDGADAASVTCADYYHNGKYLVTSSDDNSVRLYDAVSGTRKTILNAFK